MKIKGKTVLVTGATGGIGQAIAFDLAKRGAQMVLVARNQARLQQVADAIQALGQQAHRIVCDVQDEQAIQQAALAIQERIGTIDILVNAAGMGIWKPFLEITASEHQAMMNTNYWGTFWWIRQVLPGMAAQGSGCIVNVSAGSGRIGIGITSGYSASNFAIAGLSEALYREYRSKGVRVCAAYPASVRTAFWNEAQIAYDKMPPLMRYSPKMSPKAVARNVRWMIWTGIPVRIFPVFLGFMVRVNALWIRAGDLLLWKWFMPVLVVLLIILYLT